MKTIITPSIEPTPEVDTEAGRATYVLKLNLISRSDLCTELSNVMAARHNLMMIPTKVAEAIEKQRVMSDVIDKSALICVHVFGGQAISEYCSNGDLSVFIQLIHNIDEEVAQQDMDPDQHGSIMLRKLGENLKNKQLAAGASLAAPAAYIAEDTKVSFDQFMQNHLDHMAEQAEQAEQAHDTHPV
jgi:hypothetical protein